MGESNITELVFVALSEPINIKSNIYGDILNYLSKYFDKIHVICLGNKKKSHYNNIYFYSYPLLSWPKIFLKINGKKVSKILITDYFVGGIISTIFSKKWKVPMVYRCGGPWKYDLDSPIKIIKAITLKLTKPIVLKNCKKVVYNSKAIVEKKIKHNYEVIYNGVDTNLFKPIKTNKRTSKLNILFIGRMFHEKGVQYLLKSVKGMEDKVHLGLIGNGKLLKDFKKISPHSEFYGRLPKKQLPEIINQYDVVILTSLVESFPNVLLEAMACGKPVIATNIYGIPEMITDGINGFLIQPKSSIAIRKVVNRFLDNPSLIKKMGSNAQKIVKERFEKEKQMFSLQSALLNN